MTADGPSLADDEVSLGAYAVALGDAFAQIAESWFMRLVETQAPGATAQVPVARQLQSAAHDTVTELRALLTVDIASQRVGPLEILRRSVVGVPTDILRSLGAQPAQRDEFARSNFPDDLFDLTPASFGDVDPSLHEPGLVWGAAKAHVHLRRRREAGAQ